jgi:hypothetical protein
MKKVKSNVIPPAYRMLRGYTIDPGFSTRLDTMGVNESVYKVRWENLFPGPIGEYVEVIDFDPVNDCYYEPVDLNSNEILSQQGLNPSEGSPKFHQQFVYAVTMQTIENFEKALGRKIIWRLKQLRRNGKIVRKEEYVQTLRVYPHAMLKANAFYTPDKVALLFGYFQAGNKIQGSNFPGGAVFTCLSPDIVAHETTHAILDSILPNYLENTHPDVPAFHEAFADVVALLQRFSNTKLLEHQIEQTRGKLDDYTVMGELATQFGQATETGRGALRGAIGEYDKKGKWTKIRPDPSRYQNVYEAHKRGAILVATIFEAFMRLYNFRIKDMIRIATQGSGVLPQGSIHPDLVKRLAAEASDIASHLLSICIRALDYCPPFDITFGDYLRALITADTDICPDENNGYRVALIEAFRAWGIFPDKVMTLSIYSLRWSPPNFTRKEQNAVNMMAAYIKNDIRALSGLSDRKKIANAYSTIQAKLQNLLLNPAAINPAGWRKYELTQKVWDSFLKEIGVLTGKHELKLAGEHEADLTLEIDPKLEVHSIRPAFRVGRENSILEQVIITLTQVHKVKAGRYKDIKFRGGCTMVFSIVNDVLTLNYIVLRRFDNVFRLERQANYQLGMDDTATTPASTYGDSDANFQLNFENLHLH